MLQKENRLKKVRDFNLLIKHGRWVGGAFFNLKFVNLAELGGYFSKREDPDSFKKQLKIAFSVGVKLDKRAVKRNRLRRQAREAVRLLIKQGRVKNGFYVLLVAKKEGLDQDYAKLSRDLELLFKKARLLQG